MNFTNTPACASPSSPHHCSFPDDPVHRSLLAVPPPSSGEHIFITNISSNDLGKEKNSFHTNQTTIAVPPRPRLLAPTVFFCGSAFMEIFLSIEYFLDVICGATFHFNKERSYVSDRLTCSPLSSVCSSLSPLQWEGNLYRGSSNCKFIINIYQEGNATDAHLIEFLMLQVCLSPSLTRSDILLRERQVSSIRSLGLFESISQQVRLRKVPSRPSRQRRIAICSLLLRHHSPVLRTSLKGSLPCKLFFSLMILR
jgi:hypothetical protein